MQIYAILIPINGKIMTKEFVAMKYIFSIQIYVFMMLK